jgi:hypothetical protein
LTSSWAAKRGRGGHAYLAINDGGRIEMFDPHTGEWSGWPPHWGEGAINRTAVGYLDADGHPVVALYDVPLQLVAADLVGNVKGHPDAYLSSLDPAATVGLSVEVTQRHTTTGRDRYRATGWRERVVDAAFADPLGDVLDTAERHEEE